MGRAKKVVEELLDVNKIVTLFKEGVTVLQMDGLAAIIKRIFFSLSRPFFEYRVYYLYENNLDNKSDFAPRINNYTLKMITAPKEVDDLIADGFNIESYYADIDALKERIEKRAILFSIFVDRDLAHTSWVALTDEAKEDIDPLRYAVNYRNEVCFGDSRTILKHQKLGIYTYVCSKTFQYLREKGITKARFAVRKNNTTSQKAHAKVGSVICGEMRYLKLFRREFYKEKRYNR